MRPLPTGEEFPIGAGEDILTAALRHGINLQYGCRHGNCSSCKHWLIDGEVDDSAASVYAIPREERESGAILLCCTFAKSDLVVEIHQHDGVEALPPMTPPSRRRATVLNQYPMTPNLVELRVKLDEPLRFGLASTRNSTLDSGERRSYSMVNPPSSAQELTFCVKRIPNGVFSALLDHIEPGSTAASGGTFRHDVPEGHRPPDYRGGYRLRDRAHPVDSRRRCRREASDSHPVLLRSSRGGGDLVYLDQIAAISTRLKDFQFIPCLSQGALDSVPNSRSGRVTRAIAADIRDG